MVFREFDNVDPKIQKLLADSIERGSIEVDQKPLDLTNTVFFFTSNIGNREAGRLRKSVSSREGETEQMTPQLKERLRNAYMSSVRARFNPEFVGKITGGFTVFDHLDPELVRTKIIDQLIQDKVGLRIATLSEPFRDFLASMYDVSLGVRPIKNFIITHIDPQVVRLGSGLSQRTKKGNFMLDLAYGEYDASGLPKILLRKLESGEMTGEAEN